MTEVHNQGVDELNRDIRELRELLRGLPVTQRAKLLDNLHPQVRRLLANEAHVEAVRPGELPPEGAEIIDFAAFQRQPD